MLEKVVALAVACSDEWWRRQSEGSWSVGPWAKHRPRHHECDECLDGALGSLAKGGDGDDG